MVRKILAVLAGVVAAMVVILLMETIGHQLYPTATTVDWKNTVAVRAYMDAMPLWSYLWIWLGWVVGSAVAGFVAYKIVQAHGIVLPLVIGGLLTASAVMNFVSIPHPVWFVVLGVLTFVPFVFTGWQASMRLGKQVSA
jgi:hypothetical protein